MTTAIVLSGGVAPDPALAELLPASELIIAADSGLDHGLAMGVRPTVLVGDLDSISAEGLAWAEEEGIDIHRYPPDKDMTDLELALGVAAQRATAVIVVDSGKGRFDHAYANLALLASDRYAMLEVSAVVDGARLTVVRGLRMLRRDDGRIVSLFAVGGDATGVTTQGLRWELTDAVLSPGSTWGVSNELVTATGTVTVTDGVILAIQVESD